MAALAYDGNGQLVGEAALDPHPFKKGEIRRYRARIDLFGAAGRAGGPRYIADDGGCVCVPGQPWVGTGSGSGCDARIITSFARLGDTAGCELPGGAGAPLPVPVCDGQQYREEPIQRALPCWADDGNGACRVGVRGCTDQYGVAWDSECSTSADAPALPSATLCAQYLACEQTACGDVVGCFKGGFARTASAHCTLRLDGTTKPDEPIKPCSGGEWKAELPGGAAMSPCLAAVVEGTSQPPFHVGLVVAMEDHPQPVASDCPTTLWVEAIDSPYPEAVPATQTVDVVVGETLTHVTIDVVRSCVGGGASLVCTPG
jgi:hypothetical protein